MSGFLKAIDVSATGLTLQRQKMDAVAQNIANAETTRTKEGGPYHRKRVVVSEAKEKAPFRTVMSQAKSNLSRTNSRHMTGLKRMSNNDFNVSKAAGQEIADPASSYRLVHNPDHPDADEKGMVKMPDIEIVNEMVDMMTASRAYEANTMAILTSKEMAKNALEI
jgi:flagellar basal-body rod protein FlgC